MTLSPLIEKARLEMLDASMRDPCLETLETARSMLARTPGLSGYQVRLWETWRSPAEQFDRWARGRTQNRNGKWVISDKRLVVTQARPSESAHNASDPDGAPAALAFDLVIASRTAWLPDKHPAWAIIPAAAAQARGDFFACGAFFRAILGGDWPHCERRDWRQHRAGGTLPL